MLLEDADGLGSLDAHPSDEIPSLPCIRAPTSNPSKETFESGIIIDKDLLQIHLQQTQRAGPTTKNKPVTHHRQHIRSRADTSRRTPASSSGRPSKSFATPSRFTSAITTPKPRYAIKDQQTSTPNAFGNNYDRSVSEEQIEDEDVIDGEAEAITPLPPTIPTKAPMHRDLLRTLLHDKPASVADSLGSHQMTFTGVHPSFSMRGSNGTQQQQQQQQQNYSSRQRQFVAMLPPVLTSHSKTSNSKRHAAGLSGRLQAVLAVERQLLAKSQRENSGAILEVLEQPQLEYNLTKCLCRCDDMTVFGAGKGMLLLQSKATREVDLYPGAKFRLLAPWQPAPYEVPGSECQWPVVLGLGIVALHSLSLS